MWRSIDVASSGQYFRGVKALENIFCGNYKYFSFSTTRQDSTGMFGGILSYWTTDTSNRSTLTAEDRKAQENAANCIKVSIYYEAY